MIFDLKDQVIYCGMPAVVKGIKTTPESREQLYAVETEMGFLFYWLPETKLLKEITNE